MFLAIAGLALGAVVVASRFQPAPPQAAFDRHTRKRIARLAPDVVLLGNSMVHSRFHEPSLNRLLAPRRIAVLGVPGTKSAVWYLTLKNQVLPVVHPKRVLIFFYGPELTAPTARATGAEHFMVERVSIGEEPVVVRKLAPGWDEPVRHIAWRLNRLAPVERLHALAEQPRDRWATRVSEWAQGEPDPTTRSATINDLFALGNLRSVANAQEQESDAQVPDIDGAGAFADSVEQSFLPDILDLARRARVPLTFVHIRLRSVAEGQPLPRRYRQYLKDLEKYVGTHGAAFVDMTGEKWEDLSLYGEGTHIALHHRRKYTKLFVAHMSRLFQ